jgi:hypothetical protein
MNELSDVIAFRNRLVAFMNFVQEHVQRYAPIDPEAQHWITAEQPWLSQEYGRLSDVINRFGTMRMGSPALGITSHDVVQDAIYDLTEIDYSTIARLTVQHLDMLIGKLRAKAERTNGEPERKPYVPLPTIVPDQIYRVTSPLYWIGRLVALLRWLLGTAGGRIVTIVGAISLAIIGGVASGFAQAILQKAMAGH